MLDTISNTKPFSILKNVSGLFVCIFRIYHVSSTHLVATMWVCSCPHYPGILNCMVEDFPFEHYSVGTQTLHPKSAWFETIGWNHKMLIIEQHKFLANHFHPGHSTECLPQDPIVRTSMGWSIVCSYEGNLLKG